MATPTALNELEQLDNLLLKLDAVRYALPQVVEFFATTSATSAGQSDGGTSATIIDEYRIRVSKVERSLNGLNTGATSLSGTLTKLASQADSYSLPQTTPARIRKNPYSGQISGAVHQSDHKPTIKAVYPSQEPEVTSRQILNDQLTKLASKHSSMRVLQQCEDWNTGLFILQLEELAVFHVFLTWTPTSGLPRATFLRFNVVGIEEKKDAFELSAYALWRNVSLHASQALQRHGRKSSIDLACLFSLIESFKAIYETPCRLAGCSRLLHPTTRQLATSRVFQAINGDASNEEWTSYHEQCYQSIAS